MSDCFEQRKTPAAARVAPGPGHEIFEFEQDFAGSLRCIPMVARFKLDLAGVKLTLRQWSQLDRPTRGRLVDGACDSADAVARYRAALIDDIGDQTDEPPKTFEPSDDPEWTHGGGVAEAVVAWCARIGVASPSDDQWRGLTDLQRFALLKLTRPGHDNDNFYPALVEFGLAVVEPAGTGRRDSA